jgi:hypothetical protein
LIIRTANARALEKFLQAALELRGDKIVGGGDEWYMTTRDQLVELYRSIVQPSQSTTTPLFEFEQDDDPRNQPSARSDSLNVGG